jgi:tetratricopeptide (TPR) repeat protein
MSDKDEQTEYDNRRKEFLYDINTTGKYHILKEKMKKTIVRIVKEHFGKTGQLMGLHKNEIDHFYSELYVFLTGIMRDTVKEMVAACENELHQNVTISEDQALRERDHLIEKHIHEDVNARNERLAFEEEFLRDNAPKAEKYLVELIKANEGDAKSMLKMSRFYMRQGKLEKAEVYLRDAFAFENENQEVALAYACLLC